MSRRTNLTTIDQLGAVQAQIAELLKQEEALKAKVRAYGDGAHEGVLFRATVSSSERETFNAKAARAKLWAEGYYAFVKKHTKHTPTVTVRVVAKTGQMEKAA